MLSLPCSPLLSFPSLLLYCRQAKIGPSLGLLSLLRETFGTQRIVLQLSFPDFFFSCVEPRRVFYPFLQHEDEGRGEQAGSSDSGCCHSNFGKQTKSKLHIAAGSWWRITVVWFGHSGGVARSVWNRGGSVTWAICEPQDRWSDAFGSVRYISLSHIPYHFLLLCLPPPAPPQKPLEPGAVTCLCLDSWLDIEAEQQAEQQSAQWSIINCVVK